MCFLLKWQQNCHTQMQQDFLANSSPTEFLCLHISSNISHFWQFILFINNWLMAQKDLLWFFAHSAALWPWKLVLLALPAFPLWNLIVSELNLWQAPLKIVLKDGFNGEFQADDLTITHLGINWKICHSFIAYFFLSVLKQRQMLSWGWNNEKWNKQPLQISVSPSNKHSRQTDTSLPATENQLTIPSWDYFQICRNQITCHLIIMLHVPHITNLFTYVLQDTHGQNWETVFLTVRSLFQTVWEVHNNDIILASCS